MFFYELHEGDDDLMSDVILACETEVSPDDFFDLVRRVRAEVEEGFEEDTLIEAIAVELERSHGFTYVSDDRLVGAVRIAPDPEDDRLIGGSAEDDDDADGEDADEPGGPPEYLTIMADFEPDIRRN